MTNFDEITFQYACAPRIVVRGWPLAKHLIVFERLILGKSPKTMWMPERASSAFLLVLGPKPIVLLGQSAIRMFYPPTALVFDTTKQSNWQPNKAQRFRAI